MIGLLSFHRAKNYGAVLQAYALQKSIEKEGKDCEYINIRFNSPQGNQQENRKTFLQKFKNIKRKLLLIYRSKKFCAFCEKYLKVSQESYLGDSNICDMDKYDSYIVGSDQVWNLRLTKETKSFLLHFVSDNKRKNSYASSFGVDSLPEKYERIIEKYLPRFENISVREQQGAELIKKITGIDAVVCLDPTLLLTKQEWTSIEKKSIYKNYVFICAMDDTDTLIERAREIAKKNKLRILAVGLKKNYKGVKNIYAASPEQWLGLINNAHTVVTNSFHGTAFSINLNKEFFVEYLPEGWTVNSRLENIVKLFGIEDRVIGNSAEYSKEIEFTAINEKLISERKKSLKYLRRICE